jgi:hypothetical protein
MPSGASKVSVRFRQGQQNVTGLPTANSAVVGVTERGPIGVRTTCTSPEYYKKVFGGYISSPLGEVPKNVQQFFDCGGTQLDVTRICHYTDITDPNSYTAVKGNIDIENTGAAPTAAQVTSGNSENFALDAGDTLLISIDGGGDVTTTFAATAGTMASSGGAFPIADQVGLITNISIDGGATQSVIYTSPATTNVEIAAQMNTQLSGCSVGINGGEVEIVSDKEGTASSVAYVAAGSTSAITWAAATPGTGVATDIKAITSTEVGAAIDAAMTPDTLTTVNADGTFTIATVDTGATASIKVNSGTAVAKFNLDTDLHEGADDSPQATLLAEGKTEGSYANSLSIVIGNASNGNAEFFNLTVTKSGVVQETFKNVTMDSTNLRYVLTVVNDENSGSNLIALSDYDLIGGGLTATEARPEVQTWGPLANGDDGLSAISDSDFIGSEAGYTGLYSFDSSERIRLVSIPGRASASIHAALNAYVEHRNKELYVVHPTPTLADVANTQAMEAYANANTNGTSEFACIAWPRIAIPNPSTAVFGTAEFIYVDPSMSKMGRFAYNDRNNADGVFVSTAGVKDDRGNIPNCIGVESADMEIEANRDILADVNVEPIVKFDNTAYHFDGGDNLKTSGDWPRQWHARGAISIVTAIKGSSLWTKHSKNNAKNRTTQRIEANGPARVQDICQPCQRMRLIQIGQRSLRHQRP